jgi:type VI secretion system protein ImpL
MKKVIELLKNRIVVSVLGLLLLSFAIWFGLAFIRFGADNATVSGTARLVIILLCWLAWILKLTWELWQAARSNREMTADIKASTAPAQSDPYLAQQNEDELSQLRARFVEALGTLAKSRIGAGNSQIYQLPWYLVMGPPGAGKTTLLAQSGLEFPLARGNASGGSTRHCDWWFTNEAVLIDTAGRFITQDRNRKTDSLAWTVFLELLKKYRRRRPVNGLVLTISAQDLLLKSEPQRRELALTLRQRIEELQEKLSVQAPIYLLITKADLLAGFVDFFAGMTAAEREQIWGLSFDEQGAGTTQLKTELGELIRRIDARVARQLQQERDPGKRAAIQNFPAQVGELAAVLLSFFADAFNPDNYRQTPLVRGVYLSSATQEGTPVDRVLSVVSTQFRLGRTMLPSQSPTGRSFFIHHLFKRLIFPEADLGGVDFRLESRLVWSRRLAIIAAATAMLTVSGFWISSAVENRTLMDGVRQQTDAFTRLHGTWDDSTGTPAQRVAMLDTLRQASSLYDQDRSPWLNNLGLYDDRVNQAADRLYANALHALLRPQLKQALEGALRRALASKQEESLFSTLQAYLMLAHPDRLDAGTVQNWFSAWWDGQHPDDPTLQSALLIHLQALLQQPGRSIDSDPQLVAGAREQLARLPVPERLYEVLLSRLARQANLHLLGDIGQATLQSFGLESTAASTFIPYRFSRTAYEDADFSASSSLIEDYKASRWILGEDAQAELEDKAFERIAQRVRELYLNDYLKFWQARLTQYPLADLKSLDQATETLSLLADPARSPLLKVLERIERETTLTEAPDTSKLKNEKLAGAIDAVSARALEPTPVDSAFKPLHEWLGKPDEVNRPSLQTLKAIEQLQSWLANITLAPDRGAAAFEQTRLRFGGQAGSPLQNLRRVARNVPTPIQGWLDELADDTWGLLIGEAWQHANGKLATQVCAHFERQLAGRYPLAPGSQDAAAADFDRYFAPNGLEAGFVAEYVKPFVDVATGKPQTVDRRSFPVQESTLEQLRRSALIRQALYQSDPASASLTLDYTPLKLDAAVKSFSIELGHKGTRIAYSHGPKLPKKASWQSGTDNFLRLLFIDINGTEREQEYRSEWALLRLFDDSRRETGKDAGEFVVTFSTGGREARYAVKARTSLEAIRHQSLLKYSCPARL